MICFLCLISITVALIVCLVLYQKITIKRGVKCINIDGKHVVITGGSSGIGKSVAILAAQRGAHVSILARNEAKLCAALVEIQNNAHSNQQQFTKQSVDVSKPEQVRKCIDNLESSIGPVFMLVNCAGAAECGLVEDFSVEQITRLLNVNYLGALYTVQEVAGRMKERGEGIIVLTGSQASLMGMYGMSVYSSCKFALRGLAESIAMELKPHNISVTLCVPPDTDTPGFEEENRNKLPATKIICSSGGIYQPIQVAEQLLKDALEGRFFSSLGFESFMVTTLCTGMSPFLTGIEVFFQSLLLGPFRLVAAFYLVHFDSIIKKCLLHK